MLIALAGWGGATFGFQLLLVLTGDSSGNGPLTSFTFFHLPFHFWFTAQLLPLLFIVICALFNSGIDRLTERQSRRREGFHD
jgi:putative solute:sodium symporter small subunit